jgi:hypothetical protein
MSYVISAGDSSDSGDSVEAHATSKMFEERFCNWMASAPADL